MRLLATILLIFIATSALAREHLIGAWQTGCISFGKNNRHSFVALATVDPHQFRMNFKMFADSNCQVHNLNVLYEGAYSLKSGGEIDHTPQRVEMVIYNEEALRHYKTAQGCGISDWRLGQPMTVAGRFCKPLQMPRISEVLRERYFLAGDTLQFGLLPLKWTNSSPKDRPGKPSGIEFSKIH